MSSDKLSEVWLRGPVQGISAELQPVSHALLQAQEEINALIAGMPDELLWARPGGVASPAFHLQHIAGVLDRMITYKDQMQLNEEQLTYLDNEGRFDGEATALKLLHALNKQIDKVIKEVKHTDVRILKDHRNVGHKKLPSTVGGLLFHMAEHTMRHTGQLLVTVRVLQSSDNL